MLYALCVFFCLLSFRLAPLAASLRPGGVAGTYYPLGATAAPESSSSLKVEERLELSFYDRLSSPSGVFCCGLELPWGAEPVIEDFCLVDIFISISFNLLYTSRFE